jgi:general L-amino acid transport system permease protein
MAVVTLSQPRLLWQRRRTRRLLIQAAFGVALALLLLYLASRAARIQLGFDFLDDRAGFAISHQWITTYSGNDARVDAYVTGVWNTIRLVAVGLVLAPLLGVVAGVSRLSKNWLVSRLATVYVEVFRNTPLLVQIIFWYTAVILQLPSISRRVVFAETFFLSNRSLAVPWAFPEDITRFAAWVLLLAGSAIAAWSVRRWRVRLEEQTGEPGYANAAAAATFLGLGAAAYVATGFPLDLEIPGRAGGEGGGLRQLLGGMQVTPEFAALLVALVIYTGAFIAEIVRGSIQALPRGQGEAAMALGLSGYQRTTLVILPQALRTMIPPLTNQYLNLTKNSSLAVAIAYPDLVFVARTIQNNAGHAVPMFLVVMATYLVLSLLISVAMNTLNRRVQVVGR